MVTWTGLLFVLCGALTSALCCDWLTHYKQPSKEARDLLTRMGDQLTEQHPSVHRVRFPKHLYKQIKNSEVESKLVFIRDSLQLIFCLYRHGNLSAAPWGTDKTDGFLTVIHRQIKELSACVSTNSPANSRLRSYYRTLANSTLSCSGCSTASWQLLRKETKLRLDQLELLVASIRVPAAASRRRSAATQQQRNTDTISKDCF
ncbi:interferon a3-like [Pelmatolapia mariae]|uniref:interferon a3-like n=1 Tax=Pelmatolapia mariae TaxID=158779 RepID=UPI002FE67D74